jgi:hypothetical protein
MNGTPEKNASLSTPEGQKNGNRRKRRKRRKRRLYI